MRGGRCRAGGNWDILLLSGEHVMMSPRNGVIKTYE